MADNFEDTIRKAAADSTAAVRRAPTSTQDGGALIKDACEKAAEMVRSVHTMHKEEGETLAQHLEQIGETFMKLCKEAARNVREMRIMPQEMAEATAKDLAELGQREYDRFNKVTAGLISARDALVAIDDVQKEASNAPEVAVSDHNDLGVGPIPSGYRMSVRRPRTD